MGTRLEPATAGGTFPPDGPDMSARKAFGTLAMMAFATGADASTIRGHLHVAAPKEVTVGSTVVEPAGVEASVVWVDSLPPKMDRMYRARPRKARVVQADRRFSPPVTVVPQGSKVAFANRDRIYHNVFSISPAKRFDLGKYPPRESHTVTFDQTGIVNLFCDIHPFMAAYVVVLPNRAFTRPNRAGAFVLPALAPGHYVLHAWHPTAGSLRREVDVPLRGDAVVALSL